METEWLSSENEVSDVHQDAKTGLPIVDELILGPPSLGWTGFRPKYTLASGLPCATEVMLLALHVLLSHMMGPMSSFHRSFLAITLHHVLL